MASEDKKTKYIVYDHKDWPRCVGTAAECAAYMGIRLNSLWANVMYTKRGKYKCSKRGEFKVYKIEEGEEA